MDFQTAITILALLLGSGGIIGQIVAWRKSQTDQKRADVDIQAIFLDVNKKVQESYTGIIDELQDELTRLSQRIDKQRADFILELSSRDTIIEDLKIRLGQTESRLRETEDRLQREIDKNSKLTERVETLEEEKERLRVENDRLRGAAA